MRKILIGIITVLLAILVIKTVSSKLSIGNTTIYGIEEIKAKEQNLDQKIEQENKTKEAFKASEERIETSYKELTKAKTEYEEKVALIVSKNTEEAKLLQNYSIEFLWIQIGQHQKKEGVKLDLSFSKSGSSSERDLLTGKEVELYNMNFTVTGNYEAITDFIYDIEGDSKLGFEIEDFTLNPNEKEKNLVATFKCSEVRIYKDSLSKSSGNFIPATNENDKTQDTNENDKDENTTNSGTETQNTTENTKNEQSTTSDKENTQNTTTSDTKLQ